MSRRAHKAVAVMLALAAGPAVLRAAETGFEAAQRAGLERLVAAYPDALDRVDGGELVWRDGTRMKIDDGGGPKLTEGALDKASILDMVREPYPAGGPLSAPTPGTDPGRARNAAFFTKLYGDCAAGQVEPHLKEVAWLPTRGGRHVIVKVTDREDVADHLKAVSDRLEKLPAAELAFITPPAGGYNCRAIAGTGRRSTHGYGIAIDVALKYADYWRWSKPGADGKPVYHNQYPADVVAAFEAEGFIWGGRWFHFDTMHFEYRPELLPARSVQAQP